MTTEPSSPKLPTRTPDPVQVLAGLFQRLLSEYASTVAHALPHIPDKAVRNEMVKHTSGIHQEACKALKDIGELVESRKKAERSER
jgi:hypothetical protein